MLKTLASFSLIVGSFGCSPIIARGPVVEPGWSGGVGGGAFQVHEACAPTRECRPDTYPLASLSLRYGRVNEQKPVPATSIGISIPDFQLDLYRQLGPGSSEVRQWGVGTLLSPLHIAPYLQIGRMRETGRGWYTSQVISFAAPWAPGEITGARRVFWAPSLTVQRAFDRGTDAGESFFVAQLHGYGIVGVRRYSSPTGTVPHAGIGAAISLEVRRKP